ncbi:MAG: hypothetical protein ACXVRH_06365 [Thermoleophilaceae bacterium]
MRRNHIYLLAALSLTALLALSAQASAKTIKGTVVHRNSHAGSFVVAGRHGSLSAIHTSKRPREGSVVAVSARRLSNGTFAARRIKSHGKRRHARVTGSVTWVGSNGFTVSARGASILVNGSDNHPEVGDHVNVGVTVDDQGDLQGDDVKQLGGQQGNMRLEGSVQSIDSGAGTITVTADDDDQSGATIVVHVPDTTQFTVGQEVELLVSGPASDGSFTLVAADDDGQDVGGDNGGDHQGGGDHHGGGDNSGPDNGGDGSGHQGQGD